MRAFARLLVAMDRRTLVAVVAAALPERRNQGARLVGKVWMQPDGFVVTPGTPSRPPKSKRKLKAAT